MKWARNVVGVVAILLLVAWIVSSLFVGFRFRGARRSFELTERGYTYSYDRWMLIWPNRYQTTSAPGLSIKLPEGIDTKREWGFTIPHWLASATACSLFLVLRWRSQRPPQGHCQNCGYDLTLNESGVCPECGEAVEVTA